MSAKQLLMVGFSHEELKEHGISPEDLIQAQNSLQTMKRRKDYKIVPGSWTTAMKDSLNELLQAGFSTGEVIDIFTKPELEATGLTMKELKAAGFTAEQLQRRGFEKAELSQAFLMKQKTSDPS